HMVRARIGLALPAAACDVARAILIGAEERAASVHFLFYTGLAGIETVRRPLRIARERSLRNQRLIVVVAIPVAGPFPHVAGHVVESVGVRRERGNRGSTLVAVFFRILVWKMPLEGVRHELAAWLQLIAPGVGLSFQPAALREFVFSFLRQALAGPFCVGQHVFIGDVHDRILPAILDRAFRSL